MNSTVYNYFLDNYGYENAISEEKIALKKRFKNSSKKDLREELKILKLNNASINTIKYVGKSIRSRINKSPINIAIATDNDDDRTSVPAPLFFHLSTPFRVLPTLPTYWNV